jgi:uncharacterized iron-regulated membrane protein
MKLSILQRKLHRWGALLIALPVLVVIGTGILLQLKKDFEWIQPRENKGHPGALDASFDRILETLRTVPEAKVKTWADVNRLDVRPDKGMVKVWCKNHWEVQLDTSTAAVLQVAYRRSDLIESLHDGSWFHDAAKRWVFLPAAVILFGLWLTGIYLFFLPHWVKWRRPTSPDTLRS